MRDQLRTPDGVALTRIATSNRPHERHITETWYDDLTDADAQQNARKTYSTPYYEAGRVASVGDGSYDFDYTYSVFGNLTSTTQDLNGLTDDVEFSYGYDVLERKTSVSAKVGATDDYVNTYSMIRISSPALITISRPTRRIRTTPTATGRLRGTRPATIIG